MLKRFFAIGVVLLTFTLLALGSGPQSSAEVLAPTKGPTSFFAQASADPLLTLRSLVPIKGEGRERKIKQLMKSVAAIEDGRRQSAKKRRRVAEAALYAQEKTGIDAVLMVAVARMETDFQNLVMINTLCKLGLSTTGCHADCGMTQHHVSGSMRWVTKQCNKLRRKPKYSFFKSAQELARHVTWCKAHARRHRPLRRCVLNRYNMGPFYKTRRKCNKRHRCHHPPRHEWETKEEFKARYTYCARKRRKCRARAGYWKKVTCFEYGARHHVRSKRSCRRCYSLKKIATKFYPALPPKIKPTPRAAPADVAVSAR